MSREPDEKLPPGVQPWDVINGLRVGSLAGAAAGAVIALVAGIDVGAFGLGGAAIGGLAGYWSERRKRRRR